MKSRPGFIKEYAAYPGCYMPMPQSEFLINEINERTGSRPLVNMQEYTDGCKVEVMIAGAKREHIFVDVNDRILSIIVLHMACENLQQGQQLHEFDNRSIKRYIFLPANADTEFVSAEYKDGILCLHIPKSQGKPALSNQRIVVY